MKRKAPLNDERGFCLRIQSRPKGRSLGRRISSGSAAAGEFDGLADVGGGREFHQGGLGIGGDDYITKPFAIEELLARIRTTLRRADRLKLSLSSQKDVYHIKDLTVDVAKHQVLLDGEEVHFTQNEFKILELLCLHAGKVLTYDFILKHVWGPYEGSNNQILRVNMANIRRKMENNPAQPQYIFTEVGVGYRIVDGD